MGVIDSEGVAIIGGDSGQTGRGRYGVGSTKGLGDHYRGPDGQGDGVARGNLDGVNFAGKGNFFVHSFVAVSLRELGRFATQNSGILHVTGDGLDIWQRMGRLAGHEKMTRVEELRQAIHWARARVYQVGQPTPMERMRIPGFSGELWVKREDLGPIRAYKWRGAFYAMSCLNEDQRKAGVVAASAGNHAQGVALAAQRLKIRARIFMPKPTPVLKKEAVLDHGGDWVEINLEGDRFAEAQEAAIRYAEDTGAVLIPPYDSLQVMAGQGTLADEVFATGEGPFDRVYVAVGGGGMAAAVAALLKYSWPEVKVIGVEGEDQASMKAAFEAGKPVSLDYVDVFCDGTAVTQVGEMTFELCRQLLDGIVTVSNEEVAGAIKAHWDGLRVIPEPSGAMSLAGFLKERRLGQVGDLDKVLTILCGANMDFAKLSDISRLAGIVSGNERSWRFKIPEENGSLVKLLTDLPDEVNITDLQYGRTAQDPQLPVLTLEVPPEAEDSFSAWLGEHQGEAVDVTGEAATRHRVIPFVPSLMKAPLFVEVEFPERAGALLGFMKEIKAVASLCYFNYTYSGERVGRALLGLDFANLQDRDRLRAAVFAQAGKTLRSVKLIEIDAFI